MKPRNAYDLRRAAANGFTLIELAVALLIVGLLASVAVPSYKNALIKTKRAEGRAALMQLMQQEEQFYSVRGSYIAFSSASTDEHARKFKWYSGSKAASSAYEIRAEACDAGGVRHCIRLLAQPGTAQVNPAYRDPLCGTLSLNSRGEKQPATETCW
ncbi:putative major pilin subunit [compost metagenome]